jgi:hypothetical protein
MSLPQGTWSINANGFRGVIDFSDFPDPAHLTGKAKIDPGSVDNVDGTWDENTSRITFTRHGSSGVQNYTGYRFSTNDPMFVLDAEGKSPEQFFLLAGTFVDGAATYGWVARYQGHVA